MRLLFLLFALSILQTISAQNGRDSIQSRIILVGDAGSLIKGEASVLDVIRKQMNLDDRTTVLFLGDNLYDYGLPNEYARGFAQAKAALDSQIHIARGTEAKVFMIPGNHDWNNGSPGGEEAIQRQQLYVDLSGEKNVKFFPEGGCPGPVEIKISKDVVMIVMDSQWWLHPYDKPGVESDCENKIPEQVLGELEDMLARNQDKLVVFACHHPFKSNGVHGGYFTWKQHLFPFTEMRENLYIPLPVLGSIYPIARSVFGTPQDIPHPRYQNMIRSLNEVLETHPHVVRVHGHEHTLQWIQNDSLVQLVSGSGCKTQRVSDGRDTRYTARELGFAVMEINNNKRAKATFYELNGTMDSAKAAYTGELMEFSKLPVLEKKNDTTEAVFVYKDRVTAPASLKYPEVKGLKRWFNGTNYRKEWSEPVTFPVFNINKEKGGFKISGVGGGKQTKSMTLLDKQGREWSLRTIDKDPTLALPAPLRGSFANSIVQDFISASHPYGALPVPVLSDAVGLTAPHPEFFYVPDDPALGYYRPYFASKICMLERKEWYTKDDDSKSTQKLFNKMREDNDQTVDQSEVLKARLVDMLVGDWDRHFDQWKWIPSDTGKGKYFKPVPRDRDQAFSWTDGVLPRIASRRFAILNGFTPTIRKVEDWNTTAKDFDRYFLNQLDRHAWDSITSLVIGRLPDTVLSNSVHRLPPEIYALNGQVLTDKLKSRRADLQGKSLDYYRFISEEVQVLGSNKDEFFHLTEQNGKPKLMVYSYEKDHDTSFVVYDRIFDPAETKEIRMFGFGGDDRFLIDESVRSRIKVRIIGGRGEDSFIVKSGVKAYLYDNISEKNGIERGRHTHNKLSAAADVNRYDQNSFKYSVFSYPKLALGYNGVDGVFVGTGFGIRTHHFRKEPFSTEHKFAGLFAVGARAHTVKYTGEFNQVFGKNDILVNARYSHPGLNFFFGFGNNTKIPDGQDGDFYRVRYNYLDADVLVRHRLARIFSISVGPTVFHYWNKEKDNRKFILSEPQSVGLDSADVFQQKTYVGGKIVFDLNNINNELFPTRGISWKTQFTSLHAVHSNLRAVNKIESDLAVYASLKEDPRVVTVLKMGAGHIFEDSYEFFQAMSFGANRDLRGFRRNRYSGSTMAYGSLELRLRLFETKGTVMPGQFGLMGFGDLGRVWVPNEQSRKWHPAAGGGIYFAPFNFVIIGAGVAVSDEVLFNFSVGKKLNITF